MSMLGMVEACLRPDYTQNNHDNAGVRRGQKNGGVFRELNSGPPAPEAGIIPLDQIPEGSAFLVHLQRQEGALGSRFFAALLCAVATEALSCSAQLEEAGPGRPR